MGNRYESDREILRSQISHLSEIKKQYEQLGQIEVESLGKEAKVSITQFNKVKIQINSKKAENLSEEEISAIVVDLHNYGRSKINENIDKFSSYSTQNLRSIDARKNYERVS